jgi:quinol monooxygenase YgiN
MSGGLKARRSNFRKRQPPIHARHNEIGPMICITVLLTVKNEADVLRVKDWLAKHGGLSRAEPGCQRFELYHSESDPKVFILNERWESEDLLAQHRLAEGYTTIYVPHVLPLVDRVPHRSVLVSG